MNALLLQEAGRFDALPGGGDFDQHPVNRHARALVQIDQPLGAGNGGVGVKRQAGIDLGRNAPRHHGQNLAAKAHQQAVHQVVQGRIGKALHHLVQQRRVLWLLHGFQNQRGVGGGILGPVLRQLLKIAGVGHHGGDLF